MASYGTVLFFSCYGVRRKCKRPLLLRSSPSEEGIDDVPMPRASLQRAQVAVAVFAIPTGIFGAGFEDMIQARKLGKEEQAALDGAADGSDLSVPGPVWSGADASSSSSSEDGHDEEPPFFSFLDTACDTGTRYRSFILTIVVLDVLAFFSSTLGYMQVSVYF